MSDMDWMDNEEPSINLNVADEVGKILGILLQKREDIDKAEAALKALKEDEKQLTQVDLPQMLKKHHISQMAMNNGITITASEELSCSLIKDEERRKLALAWLIDNGGEDLIKDQLTIESPSANLLDTLNKGGVVYSLSKDVNVNSLKAWFREKLGLKRGILASVEQSTVPKEFGLYTYDLAKIKEPKGGVL